MSVYEGFTIYGDGMKFKADLTAQYDLFSQRLEEVKPSILEKLTNDEFSKEFKSFLELPDFPKIYRNTCLLEHQIQKTEYILMEALKHELAQVGNVSGQERLQVLLDPLGLKLICPFYTTDISKGMSTTQETCEIEGSYRTTCQGRNFVCVVFAEKADEVFRGMTELPSPVRSSKQSPYVELVCDEQIKISLLREVDDFWRGE